MYRRHLVETATHAAWSALVSAARRLHASPDCDAVLSVLIELGELESAVADVEAPDVDDTTPLQRRMRAAMLAAARVYVSRLAGTADCARAGLTPFLQALAAVQADTLPGRVEVSVPEGFAFYALDPAAYADAAARFARERRPGKAICIGLRSIGTTLSAVVAAALERAGVDVSLYTVRPRGHPFDRCLRRTRRLTEALAANARTASFCVVDEGPGISGSSIASVARGLVDDGVPGDRIVLFPAYDCDGSHLRSEAARKTWQAHPRFVGRHRPSPLAVPDGLDASGGRWRARLLGHAEPWPAVHPRHERVKLMTPGSIVRFAGLGKYGRAKQSRAEQLSEAGMGPPPGTLAAGYLTLPFVPGRSLHATRASPTVVHGIATYASRIAELFTDPQETDLDGLQEMIEVNMREAFGPESGRILQRVAACRQQIPSSGAVAVDGRMLPHEWLESPAGLVKIDALDHHDDHFYAGATDIAWDLAAATVEFDLEPGAAALLLSTYAAASGDVRIGQRLPFYRFAWLAFRLGYATLARDTLDGDERRRFDALARRYASVLRSQ